MNECSMKSVDLKFQITNFELHEVLNRIDAWQTCTWSVWQSDMTRHFLFQSKSPLLGQISNLYLTQSLLLASCTKQLVETTFCWLKIKTTMLSKFMVGTCKITNQEPEGFEAVENLKAGGRERITFSSGNLKQSEFSLSCRPSEGFLIPASASLVEISEHSMPSTTDPWSVPFQ